MSYASAVLRVDLIRSLELDVALLKPDGCVWLQVGREHQTVLLG